jgi:hypothetical protein
MAFLLGQRVRYTKPLRRVEDSGPWGKRHKTWSSYTLPEERRGVVVGYRTLQNGHREYVDEGFYFVPDGYVKAYLVSYDLHRKPEFVRPADLYPSIEFEVDHDN